MSKFEFLHCIRARTGNEADQHQGTTVVCILVGFGSDLQYSHILHTSRCIAHVAVAVRAAEAEGSLARVDKDTRSDSLAAYAKRSAAI